MSTSMLFSCFSVSRGNDKIINHKFFLSGRVFTIWILVLMLRLSIIKTFKNGGHRPKVCEPIKPGSLNILFSFRLPLAKETKSVNCDCISFWEGSGWNYLELEYRRSWNDILKTLFVVCLHVVIIHRVVIVVINIIICMIRRVACQHLVLVISAICHIVVVI